MSTTFFFCLYSKSWTVFAPYSFASVANLVSVIVCWKGLIKTRLLETRSILSHFAVTKNGELIEAVAWTCSVKMVFAKILRTPFFTENLRWLLLTLLWTFGVWQKSLDSAVKLKIYEDSTYSYWWSMPEQKHKIGKTFINNQVKARVSSQNYVFCNNTDHKVYNIL